MDSKLSILWNQIQKKYQETNFDEKYLENFMCPKKGDKPYFASWSPIEPTYRYFKSFLYILALNQDNQFFELYKNLGETGLGNPLFIKYKGLKINLESYTSIEEIKFLSSGINMRGINSVTEIGGGYGRTANALLKLNQNIKKYQIIDLPETFEFCSKFLKLALPESLYSKVQFVDYREIGNCDVVDLDLAFNVDGFHAMPKPTINEYKRVVLSKANFVYIKNSVCKYPPECIGLESVPTHLFENGLMTELGDIYNEDDLNKFRLLYCQRYLPSDDFEIIDDEPSGSFPFFHHVLYKRKDP